MCNVTCDCATADENECADTETLLIVLSGVLASSWHTLFNGLVVIVRSSLALICPSLSIYGRSVNFCMTANLAFDSSDSGALPGRSTTTVYTSASVAASASVKMNSQQVLLDDAVR